ncbi:DUF3866 family protein [Trueperella bialowiezensis]|nr:DUF3866 family protein [Trueperella bialowiezensis]
MMKWRYAQITREKDSWGKAIEYEAQLEDGTQIRALAYTPHVGTPQRGDRVLVTVNALERGLGTGGYAMIAALPDRLPVDPPAGAGHIVKARYTPNQVMVLGVDEEESPHHAVLHDADSITDMPVIAADLHSALPAIVAGIQHANPSARIAYIMTDGGALPAWFSKTAYRLRTDGHIIGTITAGQSYGGELEAVNVHTALLAARLVWHADVAVVAQGPGNLGTDTRWGFSGTSIGEALNAAHVLGGTSIAALRASQADPRERHLGISHHTMRVLSDVVHTPCAVVVPELTGMDSHIREKMAGQLVELASHAHLSLVALPADHLTDVLADPPTPLNTMGRGFADDPLAFLAACAAGVYGGELSARSAT